jgi:hypothetical protein
MKVKVTEVTVGQSVKGNLVSGFHTVAAIKANASHLQNTSTQLTFVNEDGVEFFVGRISAKATLAA